MNRYLLDIFQLRSFCNTNYWIGDSNSKFNIFEVSWGWYLYISDFNKKIYKKSDKKLSRFLLEWGSLPRPGFFSKISKDFLYYWKILNFSNGFEFRKNRRYSLMF